MANGPDRPRVLCIAEAANPQWTSVPLEGWSHYRAIARRADAHLITQVRNRDAIREAGLVEGEQFTAIDSEAVGKPIHAVASALRGGKGKGWTTVQALSSLTYYYFERLVWKQFKDRIRAGAYDVVHRVTPLSPTTPSTLATKCRRAGVPFVLGPLNGGLPWPRQYDRVRRQEREWLSYARSAYRMLPGYRATRRDAAALILGSIATWEQVPARYRDRCVYIPENAIDPDRFPPPRERSVGRPIRLVFVGRLVPYKGADAALEAAAPYLRDGAMRFDVVGDGPQRADLEQLVEREGIGAAVTFHGNVPHARVAEIVGACDLFAFPSIREFGGAVVVEAMAMGTVPMVVRYGGPGELATETTGFLLELEDRAGLVRQMKEVFGRLAADPGLIDARRGPAIRRAREQFTWDAKAGQVMEVYRWVMGRGEKPDFGMPLPDR